MNHLRSEGPAGSCSDVPFSDLSPSRKGIGSRLLDFLYPPRCLRCDCATATNAGLCGTCWYDVSFVAAPFCTCCGLPFELDPGEGALCGSCLADPPLFERMRAAMIYNDASRPLITGFKYADRTDRAPTFGKWLARAGTELLADCDVIVPVPLHRTRLLSRRFNQAAILSQAVGKEALVPVQVDALVRTRRTQQQVGLSPAKRQRNVRGAFTVRPKAKSAVEGNRILLVDDVVTSGATVGSSIRALRRAGAVAVDVLCLARTMKRG